MGRGARLIACLVPHQHCDPLPPSAGRLGRGTVGLALWPCLFCFSMRPRPFPCGTHAQLGREKGLARPNSRCHPFPAGPTKRRQGCCKRSKFHVPPNHSRQGAPTTKKTRSSHWPTPCTPRISQRLLAFARPSQASILAEKEEKNRKKGARSASWSLTTSRMPGRIQGGLEVSRATAAFSRPACPLTIRIIAVSVQPYVLCLPGYCPLTAYHCLPLPTTACSPLGRYHRSQP